MLACGAAIRQALGTASDRMTARIASPEGLEDEDDLRFQGDSGECKVAWVVGGLVVAAAALGGAGRGILSRARATGPNALLRVEYDRFPRREAPTTILVGVAAGVGRQGRVVIYFDRRYFDGVDLDQVTPEPLAVEAAADRLSFVMGVPDPSDSTTFLFRFNPGRIGTQLVRVGLSPPPAAAKEAGAGEKRDSSVALSAARLTQGSSAWNRSATRSSSATVKSRSFPSETPWTIPAMPCRAEGTDERRRTTGSSAGASGASSAVSGAPKPKPLRNGGKGQLSPLPQEGLLLLRRDAQFNSRLPDYLGSAGKRERRHAKRNQRVDQPQRPCAQVDAMARAHLGDARKR